MKIRAMIAEDELLARQELEFMLSSFPDIELCPSVSTGKELIEKYSEFLPDVIFLDIQMPELEGIQAAKYLRQRGSFPLIVFTTAYDRYAVEAFGLNATDYLLKPFDEKRLEEAIIRIRRQLKRPEQPAPLKVAKLLLESEGKVFVVDPASIYYLMRDERTVRIFTSNKEYQSKLTLQKLEEKLLPYHFFRSHRSFLVNLQYVEQIIPWFNGAYNLTLKNMPKVRIPVSRTAAKELLRRIQM